MGWKSDSGSGISRASPQALNINGSRALSKTSYHDAYLSGRASGDGRRRSKRGKWVP